MGLNNTRANFLVKQSNLSDKDKEFLETHLQIYSDLVDTLDVEIMQLRDTIDYGKFLDDNLLSVKESLIHYCKNTPDADLPGIIKELYNKLYE